MKTQSLSNLPAAHLLLFLLAAQLVSSVELRYSRCKKYVYAGHSICSDYMRSANYTEFLVPLNVVTEVKDPNRQAYTNIDSDTQSKLETAVVNGIKLLDIFPFLHEICQNALLGAICSSYFPPCSPKTCPNKQPLLEQFKYCRDGSEPSFDGEDDKPGHRPKPELNNRFFSSQGCLAGGNCALINHYCPIIRFSKAVNSSANQKSLLDIFNLQTTKISETEKMIGHRDVDKTIIPTCTSEIECYNPNASTESLKIVRTMLNSRFNVQTEWPKSDICNAYAGQIKIYNGDEWNSIARKLYKYTASYIAESSIPTWLPENCSSAIKQLVCASIFGSHSNKSESHTPIFTPSPETCEDVCIQVERSCSSIFQLEPAIFDKKIATYSLYTLPNDISPRLHNGGKKVNQADYEIYENAFYDKCKSVLTGRLPSKFGYPLPVNFDKEARLLNSFLDIMRGENISDIGYSKRQNCSAAFFETECLTCSTICPKGLFQSFAKNPHVGKRNIPIATNMALSSACAMPCPFNTRTKDEHIESIMIRFVCGTFGTLGGMLLAWLWVAENGRGGERTLNALFGASILISSILVIGPAFQPFQYFCQSNIKVTSQNDKFNFCILEAGVLMFGTGLLALLWFCLVVERFTIEIYQQPQVLMVSPSNFQEKISLWSKWVFYRFLMFPRPEKGDKRRFPVYLSFSICASSLLVLFAWYYQLLGYDGISSWCMFVHAKHATPKNFSISPTTIHYAPMAATYTSGLTLLLYRVIYHVKKTDVFVGLQKGILNRTSFFLIVFGLLWNFMIYKKLTSDIWERLQRQESSEQWHRCLLLSSSFPSTPLNKSRVDCPPIPSLRIDHNVAIGTEALVSGTGILLLLFWGISSAHLQFIMREFGFTRSGLLWHKDRDREQQLIVDEIRDDDRLKTKRLKSG
jgi:hypothetical protein